MWYAAFKAALSGLLVASISETARRSPAMGALIASLPVVSVLGMIWLWQDTHDSEKIASHAEATFWLVLPSLPMFLVLPALLRSGVHFYMALALCCVLTVVLYFVLLWVMKKFGFGF
ncbi:MAG: DUF3147 family protein [Alphaproteobacteria bacterium]|nr:DUF3147 family protein [Alphaproteobacteria bacterium]MBP7759108.1 DUF3147 family protein [Alphaproteobacteria bacterium]MBP7762472.1 DUF3147 family protein [Alphaproteobacteria bacterium]MBP7905565.1 DUF3147 family protein [Alphaproteobacteria bacterium]